uniref:DNA oxidative demethylase ALKBH2 n=1 Tax=Hirondellea gigas TaxID=1518452 RepID=A0A6A7G029_9CRUS
MHQSKLAKYFSCNSNEEMTKKSKQNTNNEFNAQLTKKLKKDSTNINITGSCSTEHESVEESNEVCLHKALDLTFPSIKQQNIVWKKICAENLMLDYCILFPQGIANTLFNMLEEELQYFTGDLTRIKVFGKWHNIPRKQASYGDEGLTYTYSGITTPALPWPTPLLAIRDLLHHLCGIYYNFVLVNRYQDGKDKIGEHKDDEKELDSSAPIASVSLGQPRTFYFVHQDARRKLRHVDKVQLLLEHGSLLLMKAPTNKFWYHALPPRAAAKLPRINLTFRCITKKQHSLVPT